MNLNEFLKASKNYEILFSKMKFSKSTKKSSKLTSLLLLLMVAAFFFLISSSALLISSKVTPWVDRRVCRTLLAWALRCVSLSSSRAGGTNDLKNTNLKLKNGRDFIFVIVWVKILFYYNYKSNKCTRKALLAKIFVWVADFYGAFFIGFLFEVRFFKFCIYYSQNFMN